MSNNPFNFRSSQWEGSQVISSGSTGTEAKLIVYPITNELASSPSQGVIDPTIFNTSSIGSDIYMYVSGAVGSVGVSASHGVSVFGGDLVVSGNLRLLGTSNISGSGGTAVSGAADISASYVVIGVTSSLPNDRALVAGPGIQITDNGAGVSVAVSASIQAGPGIAIGTSPFAVSASLLAGPGIAIGGNQAISASLLAGPNIQIGQVGNSYAISGTVVQQWTENSPSPRLSTTASVAIGSTVAAQGHGTDTFFWVSGTIGAIPTQSSYAVFGGDVIVSGAVKSADGYPGVDPAVGVAAGSSALTASILGGKGGDGHAQITSNPPGIGGVGGSIKIITGPGGAGGNGVSTNPGASGSKGGDIFLTAASGGAGGIGGGIGAGVSGPGGAGGSIFINVGTGALGGVDGGVGAGPDGPNGTLFIGDTVPTKIVVNKNALQGVDQVLFVSGTKGITGPTAKVVVLSGDVLVSGTLKAVSGLSGSLTRLTDGTSYLVGSGYTTITSGSNGNITISSTVPDFADISASYILVGQTSSLPNARNLYAGLGITLSDNGAGGAISVINSILAGPNITFGTVGNSIAITGSAGGGSSNWQEGSPSPRIFTTASVAIGSTTTAQGHGANNFFWISGSVRAGGTKDQFVVFSGDVYCSGTIVAAQQNVTASAASSSFSYTLNPLIETVVLSGATGVEIRISGSSTETGCRSWQVIKHSIDTGPMYFVPPVNDLVNGILTRSLAFPSQNLTATNMYTVTFVTGTLGVTSSNCWYL